ncbi:MAG TPA: LacI family DNA-binding transcriptional regulator [Bryobacteraceae bacterium]|nr:LacI family DNA-binding transcriptional regulator [Bryobacteraceae bacterium]
MRDVAERAGVSISTVSHVINKTRPISTETTARVLDAIRELGFHKNAIGRRLARGRSDSIGLIISDIENPFFGELIKSFEIAVQDRGFDVLLCTTNYVPERARKAVDRMIENNVQGVAVMTSQLDAALVDDLVARDIPVVRLDGGPVGRARSNVRVDYSAGAVEAVTHLRGLGHRNISFITGPLNRISSVTYRQAMIGAAKRLGLPPLRLVEGNNETDGGEAGVQLLLSQPDVPTAIICGNDLAALGAIRALAKAHLRVPDDISVIGADDITFARFGAPALTTIRIPRDQLGQAAFQALERMIRTKTRVPTETFVETHLVVRESTGPARATVTLAKAKPERDLGTTPLTN